MPTKRPARFAYGSILEALSRGLYPDKRHVLREFVQNAYDSILDLRKRRPKLAVQPIQVKIQPRSIFIADRGSGMSRSEVQQYRYLGYSHKQRGKHAGFRGIGKYSGIAIAEKIIVDTSPVGVPKQYRIIIHADRMLADIDTEQNPPLEEMLQKHTEFSEADSSPDDHYTFVELHNLSNEADALLDTADIKEYLSRTAPVRLDPSFKHTKVIEQKLQENISDFLAVELLVNKEAVFKPYFENCLDPEFETILFKDNEQEVLAYSWYCQNGDKGQLVPKDRAGLVFRTKNIAVGDGQLSRRMLWKGTPERAIHFFGEIHVLDPDVVPSSDRTAFEDNHARTRMSQRCIRIASILNRKAGDESAIRRFDEALDESLAVVSRREREIRAGQVPLELRDQVLYEFRRIDEDMRKRLRGPRTTRTVSRANRLMGRARRLLHSIRKQEKGFVDLGSELGFDSRLRALYEAVIEVLKEEFKDDPQRLENIINRIHQYARARLAK
jgi:hypothetical protein